MLVELLFGDILKDMKKQKAHQELIKRGFKNIPGGGVWIDKNGIIINSLLKEYTVNESGRKCLVTPYGRITPAKVVLWLFAGVTPRPGIIVHIDGNRLNNELKNIRYANIAMSSPQTIDYKRLSRLINLYFTPGKGQMSKLDAVMRMQLKVICRLCNYEHGLGLNMPYLSVFMNWVNNYTVDGAIIAHRANVGLLSLKEIVKQNINMLCEQIEAYERAGYITPRPPKLRIKGKFSLKKFIDGRF